MAEPFATGDDVAARWRPLTDAENQIASVLADDASSIIRARFPGIDAQAAAGQIDFNVLTIVCAGMVKRAMLGGSDGISSQSDTVGPFSRQQSFANPLGNVFLTAADLVLIIGYQPAASSHKFGNTTTRIENIGPAYIYGDGGEFDTDTITGN